MKKIVQNKLVIAIAAGMLLAPFNASAEEKNLMMRVRAVHMNFDNESSPVGALGVPANAIHAKNKTIPEVDFTYFFSKNLAAELVLTYPQKHTVRVTQSAVGAFRAGTLKEVPPTLLLQYHFLPDAQFRPYAGAGINYTRFSNVKLAQLNAAAGGTINSVENSSIGGALQAGFDVKVGENSYINFDVKKVYIRTDLNNNTLGKLSTLKLDPVLVGIGYGFKF